MIYRSVQHLDSAGEAPAPLAQAGQDQTSLACGIKNKLISTSSNSNDTIRKLEGDLVASIAIGRFDVYWLIGRWNVTVCLCVTMLCVATIVYVTNAAAMAATMAVTMAITMASTKDYRIRHFCYKEPPQVRHDGNVPMGE